MTPKEQLAEADRIAERRADPRFPKVLQRHHHIIPGPAEDRLRVFVETDPIIDLGIVREKLEPGILAGQSKMFHGNLELLNLHEKVALVLFWSVMGCGYASLLLGCAVISGESR